MMIEWKVGFGYQARMVIEKKIRLSFETEGLDRFTDVQRNVRVHREQFCVECRSATGTLTRTPNVEILTAPHPNQQLDVEHRNVETFEHWLESLLGEWKVTQRGVLL